ncbi:MAG: pilus assembly protein [bacterium]|nr:pilus assembly protein [bacterium]
MVVPLLAFSGGVVDYGRAVKTKSQLTAALDGAILAAMKEYSLDVSTDYKQVIRDFINKNLEENGKSYHGLALSIDVSDIGDNGEMKARVETSVKTNFLSFVGFNQFDINVGAAVLVGGKDLEVVLVLDNTGSMGGSKIAALRNSAADLVDILMPDGGGDDQVKVALVPFAEYVNIGLGKRNESGLEIPADYTHPVSGDDYKWYGCMGSRKDPLNVKDVGYGNKVPGIMMVSSGSGDSASWRCPEAPIVELTDNKALITTGIADMDASGWTYIPGGLAWGWRVLSDTAPFTSGVPDSEEDTTKVIVLMTDGENTRAPEKWTTGATVNHIGKVRGHSIQNTEGAAAISDPLTAELCKNIKDKEIVIFTIAFEIPDGSPVKTLMKNCAGNGGLFFDVDDSTQLENAFKQIGLSLLNIRLSQ